ncbi:MAG TPA: oligoendopeptidase F, partial [Hyphomicrobiaceae bacterium]|nr:oligoendopeptidase F [Hyphomicrobiaceae bacterium]
MIRQTSMMRGMGFVPSTSQVVSMAAGGGAGVTTDAALGEMPEWNLADLYSGIDDPKLKSDLERLSADAKTFKEAYQGKLAENGQDGVLLVTAVREYERVADLMGRIGAFAFLNYAGDQQDAARVKLFGDVQGHLTNVSSNFIFFELELNQIEEPDLAVALQSPELGYYRPWFDELRKEKPYQLEERVELLFNDKSQTGASAWNRLFDETMAGLRFSVAGE